MGGESKAEPEYASSFEKYRTRITATTTAQLRSISRYIPDPPGARVIDIGCGAGKYAITLGSVSSARIFASDISPAMIRKAREKDGACGVIWSLSDACRLPFREESFDCALLFLVLHVVADAKQALQEAYRVLRPGGHCLISAPSHRQLDSHTVLRFFPEARKLNKKRVPSLTKLKKLLREMGFHLRRAEVMVESTIYDTEAFMEKVRSKPNTSLRSMSDADFQRRLKAMEAALAGQGTVTEEVPGTLLIARK